MQKPNIPETAPHPSPFLSENEVVSLIKRLEPLKSFFSQSHSSILIRHYPHWANPIYEIQLAWTFDERLESYAWIWLDALEGSLIDLQWE